MNQKWALPLTLALVLFVFGGNASLAQSQLKRVSLNEDGTQFVLSKSGTAFRPWGVNYDHRDSDSALIEDYWEEEWHVIEEDFQEIVDLGANVVRIHLQTGRFMEAPAKPNEANLELLAKLLKLAEEVPAQLRRGGKRHLAPGPLQHASLIVDNLLNEIRLVAGQTRAEPLDERRGRRVFAVRAWGKERQR